MVNYDTLCFRLFSKLFPCPKMEWNPVLEYLRNMVVLYPHRMDTVDMLEDAYALCEACDQFVPLSKYVMVVKGGEMIVH